jgi:threonine aldolase
MRVDLRSDTVTTPTPRMRKAMYEAEVGDDVFEEDPTVKQLQEKAAEICGKEAALFVPSGTMANQICVRILAPRGSEVIMQEEAHIYVHEVGALATLAMVQTHLLTGKSGKLVPEELPKAFRPPGDDVHLPSTSLVCLEQTAMMGAGAVYPLETVEAICRIAHEHGAKVHMDGARLFNAVIASGIPAADFARPVDSLMFCLSKGLCCPVGSMVVGGHEFILQARKVRKMYGGGMRQVGVLAACGLVALEEMIGRLALDHEKARILAAAVESSPLVDPDWNHPETNMVIFRLVGMTADSFVEQLGSEGILILAMEDNERVRLVTHKDVSFEETRYAAGVVRRLLKN